METKSDFSYRIKGGQKLRGSVNLSGAKNSTLRLLAASLLSSESIELVNYPSSLLDAQIHVGMLEALGKRCMVQKDRIIIEEPVAVSSELKWEDQSIRNTLLILGSLLTRTGAAKVPLPGGCKLGERKYDLHEMLLCQLGADIWMEGEMLCAKAKAGYLKGTDIYLPIRSTGATENSILCGVLAKGVTRVWNPHIRPEILDLIALLQSMGAQIRVFGQEHIEVTGVEKLSGCKHTIISDNMEAITWLIASVITDGDIEILNFPFRDLEVPLIFLRESGAAFFVGPQSMVVRGGKPYPVEISTGPYPGINSDMQPLFAVYGACAKGESRIVDLRFPGRYGYSEELQKMGVVCQQQDNLLRIQGGHPLKGAAVRALDLRAGVSLCLAAVVAEGQTLISDAWQVERGYDNFVNKLKQLGGVIDYVDS